LTNDNLMSEGSVRSP